MTELEKIVAERQGPLIGYATRLVRGRERARDAVQEAFISLVEKWNDGTAKEIIDLDAWLYKVVRNNCLGMMRLMDNKNTELDPDCAEAIRDESLAPDGRAMMNDDLRMIKQLIDRLQPREREILSLKLEHNKSYKEIADIMGLKSGNVGFILHEAMKKIADGYRKEAIV